MIIDLYNHQKSAIEAAALSRSFGYFLEQGTGKTLTVLEEAKSMDIQKIIIVSPKCALSVWKNETEKWRGDFPHSIFGKTKKAKRMIGNSSVMSINYDSLNSRHGAECIYHFLNDKRFLLVVDEAHFCKTHNSKRTMAVKFLSNLTNCKFLRLLTGTPTTNGSIDAFSILNLLGSKFGDYSLSHYKNKFCEMREVEFRIKGGKTRRVWQISGSKNLEILSEEMAKYSYRVLKEDCLDLPDKIYQTIPLEMPLSIRKLYEEIKEDLFAVLECGNEVTCEASATKFLRLRQLCSGFIQADEDEMTGEKGEIKEFSNNVKIEALKEMIEDGEPVIVFAAFTRELHMIRDMLKKSKISFGLYNGATSTKRRAEIEKDFVNGKIQIFLAQEDAASTALTLVQAKKIIYFSNSLRLDSRLQSEDRAHRIGLKHKLLVIDLVISDSIEQRITNLLLTKKNVAAIIAGDSGLKSLL